MCVQNQKFVEEICTHSSTNEGFKDHYIEPDTGRPIFMMSCQTHLLKKCTSTTYHYSHRYLDLVAAGTCVAGGSTVLCCDYCLC